jgi:hypothetical protein
VEGPKVSAVLTLGWLEDDEEGALLTLGWLEGDEESSVEGDDDGPELVAAETMGDDLGEKLGELAGDVED